MLTDVRFALASCERNCQYHVPAQPLRSQLNEQSLRAANAFLAVASAAVTPGDYLDRPPADIGRDAGLPSPLAVARAVRALAARRRLEAEDGRYRLLDNRPLAPGEPESVPRAPRRKKARRRDTAKPAPSGDRR